MKTNLQPPHPNQANQCAPRAKCYEDYFRDTLGVELDEYGRFSAPNGPLGTFSCGSSDYFVPPAGLGVASDTADAEARCRRYGGVDANAHFIVDDLHSLRAHVCDSSNCTL